MKKAYLGSYFIMGSICTIICVLPIILFTNITTHDEIIYWLTPIGITTLIGVLLHIRYRNEPVDKFLGVQSR